MKKLIALLLAVACVLGLVACGGGSGSQGGNKGGANAENVTLTIGVPLDANVQDLNNNALTKYLEEQTGYNLEFQVYASGSDIAANITTATLAGEKLPDILFGMALSSASIKQFGENEDFVDLQEYFADKEGASKIWWDRLTEGSLSEYEQGEIMRKMTDVETGAIYAVPSIEVSPIDVLQYQVWINQTWLDKLNLKAPTNVDELYEVLVAFKENDCNGNGAKNDELPLMGAMSGTRSSYVVDWIINQYMYYDHNKQYSLENGKLVSYYTQESFRDALKFVNKLYKEGLLNDTAFTNNNGSMGAVTTPQNGVAKCGIFVGHLTLHTTPGNMLLEEYVPLKPMKGQTSVYGPNTNSQNCIITSSCENVDAAFNLLMVMRTEESSLRIRYGEYGVNWEYAQEGEVSDMGYPAKIRILDDPFGKPNTCQWVSATGSFTVHAEGESAVYAQSKSPWEILRSQMHAESAANYAAAAEANNPKELLPSLIYTQAEKDAMEFIWAEVNDIATTYINDFMKNKKNPNDDAMWNKFQVELEKAGLAEQVALAQKVYDRQK